LLSSLGVLAEVMSDHSNADSGWVAGVLTVETDELMRAVRIDDIDRSGELRPTALPSQLLL
jgi:hypothetical protein